MNKAVTYLRSHISPQTREVLYFAIGAAALATGVPAQESGDLHQAVTSVVLTGVALLLAVLNSAPRMAAVYVFLAAVGSAAQIVAVEHDGAAWAGYLGLAAVVLGKVIAGLRAPSGVELPAAVLDRVEAVVPPMSEELAKQLEDITTAALNTVIDTVAPMRSTSAGEAAAAMTKLAKGGFGGQHRADGR